MVDILSHYYQDSLPPAHLFEEDPQFRFATNPNLARKVAPDGGMLPFIGNTVVFTLPLQAKAELTRIQRELYHRAAPLLAVPLDPDTFHMTLHDLANGSDNPETRAWMGEVAPKAAALLHQMKQEFSTPLHLHGTWLFNMVNTSIVLGLAPDADSERLLDELYRRFHDIVPLNYALTPHITLAYFKPGCYTKEELDLLRPALCPVKFSLTLDLAALEFQTFQDMNHYQT